MRWGCSRFRSGEEIGKAREMAVHFNHGKGNILNIFLGCLPFLSFSSAFGFSSFALGLPACGRVCVRDFFP